MPRLLFLFSLISLEIFFTADELIKSQARELTGSDVTAIISEQKKSKMDTTIVYLNRLENYKKDPTVFNNRLYQHNDIESENIYMAIGFWPKYCRLMKTINPENTDNSVMQGVPINNISITSSDATQDTFEREDGLPSESQVSDNSFGLAASFHRLKVSLELFLSVLENNTWADIAKLNVKIIKKEFEKLFNQCQLPGMKKYMRKIFIENPNNTQESKIFCLKHLILTVTACYEKSLKELEVNGHSRLLFRLSDCLTELKKLKNFEI